MASAEPVAALTSVNTEYECLATLSKTARDLLRFRLYKDTEGVWVCCDRCTVWRYVAQEKDPSTFFKQDFICRDVNKRCGADIEEGPDQVFYETTFCAGSLVWAKRPDGRKEKDWLWWPALVEDSPDSVSQYFLLDEYGEEPIAYHVTFMDSHRTCGWVASRLIKPFDAQSKGLNKVSKSRVGKKQRILKEALERAKIAATYNVVDRLDNFSYIAHMARSKGLIKPSKNPADTVLNGTRSELKVLAEGPTDDSSLPPQAKKSRGRLRKRKLDSTDDEIVRKKTVPLEAPVALTTHETEEKSAPQESESVEEIYVAVQTKINSKIDVDSGYAVDEESPIEKPLRTGRKRAPIEPKKPRKSVMDSLETTEVSSQDEPEESQESQPERSVADKPRKQRPKKTADEDNSTTLGGETVKTSARRKTKKSAPQDSQISSSDPIEPAKPKTSRRKAVPPKDSFVESLPENMSIERSPPSKGTGSYRAKFAEDSGHVSSDGSTKSFGFMPTILEETAESVDFESDTNTLESTENLKVVRRRRPKGLSSTSDENEPPKGSVTFTQPVRKEKPTKTLGLSKRPDNAATAGPSSSYSMSQPLPGVRSRAKFAPPTRPKQNEGGYFIDDLSRDLDNGTL